MFLHICALMICWHFKHYNKIMYMNLQKNKIKKHILIDSKLLTKYNNYILNEKYIKVII